MLARWFSRDTLSPEERKKIENFRDPQMIRAVDAMKGALVYSRIQDGDEAPAPAPDEEAKENAGPVADAPGEEAPGNKQPGQAAPTGEAPTGEAPAESDPAGADQ
jgi:hypothetical protein